MALRVDRRPRLDGSLRSALLLGLLAVLAPLGACGTIPSPKPLHPADAIVVLGNRPPVNEAGEVRFELRQRVVAGVRAYRRGLAPVVIMTGGRAPSGHVEAEVMKDLAIRLGVPEEAIRVEGRSQSTIENARFTLELLCEGRPEPCEPELIVVTSPYHLERAGELFRCAGAAETQLAHADVPATTPRRFREGFVRLYYGFIDECARAGGADEQ